jgi:hypothetical protein
MATPAEAVDAAGDVFIADTGNGRVVKIPAGNGSQTTIGIGLSAPESVAVDGAGNVYPSRACCAGQNHHFPLRYSTQHSRANCR